MESARIPRKVRISNVSPVGGGEGADADGGGRGVVVLACGLVEGVQAGFAGLGGDLKLVPVHCRLITLLKS